MNLDKFQNSSLKLFPPERVFLLLASLRAQIRLYCFRAKLSEDVTIVISMSLQRINHRHLLNYFLFAPLITSLRGHRKKKKCVKVMMGSQMCNRGG